MRVHLSGEFVDDIWFIVLFLCVKVNDGKVNLKKADAQSRHNSFPFFGGITSKIFKKTLLEHYVVQALSRTKPNISYVTWRCVAAVTSSLSVHLSATSHSHVTSSKAKGNFPPCVDNKVVGFFPLFLPPA